LNPVKISVPATLPDPVILPFLIYSQPGRSSIQLKGVEAVTERLKSSAKKVVDVCQSLTHTKLNPRLDLVIESERLLFAIEGRSWELPLSLGILSCFTSMPLREGLTATGALREGDFSGGLSPVSYLAEKISAASKAGLKTFLLPSSQSASSLTVQGITVIPVANLVNAWEIASGIPLWRAALS
jgi:predicted ATP-dependent protease